MKEVLVTYNKSEKQGSRSSGKVRWRKTQDTSCFWNEYSVVGKNTKKETFNTMIDINKLVVKKKLVCYF